MECHGNDLPYPNPAQNTPVLIDWINKVNIYLVVVMCIGGEQKMFAIKDFPAVLCTNIGDIGCSNIVTFGPGMFVI